MKAFLTLFSAAALIASPALAQDKKARDRADQKAASEAMARGEILPIVRVLDIATRLVPGDVLKVKLEREPFGFKYEVKILAKNGRVREVELDARSGKLLQIEDD
ncbi:PepSY domain-containing protein [Sphingomonas sp.]|uniref:PepSY domain-containing protein n=1 Tax=Sphingomonas sp. TaxID=28214 RepID=UPI002ED9DA58